MVGCSLSEDGKYLLIKASLDWIKNDVFIYDGEKEIIKAVIKEYDAQFIPYSSKDKIYLLTNYQAENFKILEAKLDDIPEKLADWNEIIPESKKVIKYITFTKNNILVIYLSNVCHKVKIFNYEGRYLEDLALPEYSSLSSINTHREEQDFYFGITNFFSAQEIFYYNSEACLVESYRKSGKSLNKKDFIIKQQWYKGKDGTKIPMFILHKNNLKYHGKNPTILCGYGGFGITVTPGFPLSFIPLLKKGAVYVIANIRGGGEFGDKWHKDGMLDKKINSFNDFIKAAEYLIDKKITNKEKLSIMGGSNGGLLVGAVMILRPDLFKAAVSKVPLLDMVRFPKFLMAARWIHEYGNPQKANDLKNILKWSPYHNVKKGVKYPSILFTTANKDSRVDPLHARKMAALLQNSNNYNIALLRTESNAGHGPGKSKIKQLEELSDILAFLDWQLFKE